MIEPTQRQQARGFIFSASISHPSDPIPKTNPSDIEWVLVSQFNSHYGQSCNSSMNLTLARGVSSGDHWKTTVQQTTMTVCAWIRASNVRLIAVSRLYLSAAFEGWLQQAAHIKWCDINVAQLTTARLAEWYQVHTRYCWPHRLEAVVHT